jgi:hypothetical protein
MHVCCLLNITRLLNSSGCRYIPYDKGNAKYGEGIFQRLDHFERIMATHISGSNTSVTVRLQVLTAAGMKMQIDVSEVRTASMIREMMSVGTS